jgi:hypothetical protein
MSGYVMQGNFLSLIIEEGSSLTWKAYLWGVPRGVAKFAINAGLNTLATADNLKRWGKRTSDLCKICNGRGKQTLCHVLSACSISLDQGKYTWRHSSVLRTMIGYMIPKLNDGFKLFSDLAGHTAGSGSVFPPHIIVTAQKPDLVLINEIAKKVIIFELTCPWDHNIVRAHDYKVGKYASLVSDLSRNFEVDLFCVEVSVRGQVTRSNKSCLKSFLSKATGQRRVASVQFINNISKASLLCSYSLFCARDEVSWESYDELSVSI